MRAFVVGCLALALGAGCGSSSRSDSDPGGGGAGPTQVNLKVTTVGKGVVRRADGDCRGTCTTQYVAGTQIHLLAVPDPAASFVAWGGACSGAGRCDLALVADREVTATFADAIPPPPPPAPTKLNLSASISGPGTVTGGGLDCGDSTSTCDVMVASGTTVTLTASPADGSRFAGWGGACNGTSTTCQLAANSDVRVTAQFQPEMQVLVPNDGGNGAQIALNPTRLFWVRSGSIWSIPKTGGEAVKVAGGNEFPSTLAADDAHVYWSNGSDIFSAPADGGEAGLLFTAPSVGKLVVDERGALYWTANDSPDGSVFRLRDGVATQLAKDQHPNGAVDVDATHVYFGAWDGSGFLRRVLRDGGPVEQVLACGTGCVIRSIRVDPQLIYFRSWTTPCDSNDGYVQTVSKADFSARSLLTGNGGGDCLYYGEMDVSASVAYWTWEGGAPPFGIFRATASGSGFAAIESNGDANWPTVRVDDQAIYYMRAGAIVRRLK